MYVSFCTTEEEAVRLSKVIVESVLQKYGVKFVSVPVEESQYSYDDCMKGLHSSEYFVALLSEGGEPPWCCRWYAANSWYSSSSALRCGFVSVLVYKVFFA